MVAVCSVTDHLKSPQAFGDGMMLPEVHTPTNAVVPVAEGPVMLLLCSKLKQPVEATMQTAAAGAEDLVSHIPYLGRTSGQTFARHRQLECKKYNSAKPPISQGLTDEVRATAVAKLA